MLKDKQKDIIRAVLPSTARRFARAKGRYIARARRRTEKEALNLLSDESDWDDVEAFGRFGKREAKFRRMECWRIGDRRSADKLGPLRRWTQHLKRTSENDEEAYERVCKVLKPGQNLITRHAVDHAENWLDLKKDQYKWVGRWSVRKAEPVILSNDRFEQILNILFETSHGAINKACKDASLRVDRCKDDDPCSDHYVYTWPSYEVYDPAYKEWLSTTYSTYRRHTGQKRINKIERRVNFHNWKLCPHKLLVQERKDLTRLVEALTQWNGFSEKYIRSLKKGSALYQILLQARKIGLLNAEVEEAMA